MRTPISLLAGVLLCLGPGPQTRNPEGLASATLWALSRESTVSPRIFQDSVRAALLLRTTEASSSTVRPMELAKRTISWTVIRGVFRPEQ